ncbi:hypothetical protein ACEN4P_01530 [Marinilactibacillus psychrotolerans]|uniref:hypothetical protein n=1 Tax=Marinilactibacillus psychrotolerans TaxID=191770 RepID=UPI0038858450
MDQAIRDFKYIEKLIKLKQENPQLEIMAAVDSEVVADDGHRWWTADFGDCSVDEVLLKDERVYVRSEDEDDLIHDEMDWVYGVDYSLDSERIDLLEAEAKECVNRMNWKKVILVQIGTAEMFTNAKN